MRALCAASGQNSCDDGSDESDDVCELPQYRLQDTGDVRAPLLLVKPRRRFFRNVTAYGFSTPEANASLRPEQLFMYLYHSGSWLSDKTYPFLFIHRSSLQLIRPLLLTVRLH